MKKTITFALLMLASIGVFAHQKTYSNFKGIAIHNSVKLDYPDVTLAIDVTDTDYQETVSTDNLTEPACPEASSVKTMVCGQSGYVIDETGVIGEWYTTCVENGPPFPKHIILYEK
jgi:hypothetical protein